MSAGLEAIEADIGVYLTPQLKTVAQPMEELGRLGFQMALAAIEGRPNPSPGPLKSRLVFRHSTGSARREPAKRSGRRGTNRDRQIDSGVLEC